MRLIGAGLEDPNFSIEYFSSEETPLQALNHKSNPEQALKKGRGVYIL